MSDAVRFPLDLADRLSLITRSVAPNGWGQWGRAAALSVLSVSLLGGCGGSESKSEPGPPTFSTKQAVTAIRAIEATKLSPLGVAAGSETFGITVGWTSEGRCVSATQPPGGMQCEALNPIVEARFAIEDDFDDPTYFENNPSVACRRSVSMTSVTGGGRSKKADALQSEIVADLAEKCASDPLTGEELVAVLTKHGYSIQAMAAGSGSATSPQVVIRVQRSAKDASKHAAAFNEVPLPGNSVGAVGPLVVDSRGPRSGTEFTEAKAEFDAAMDVLNAGL